MEGPLDIAADIFDKSGVIRMDVSCRRCGYNLRGLRRDGRCPECGRPVGLSLLGDLLRYADPNWVESLARGSRLILNGLSASLIAAIAAAAVAVVAQATAGGTGSIRVQAALAVCRVAAILGLLAFYYGAWVMTSPDPTRVGEDLYATSRKLVRITLLVGVGNTAMQMILASLPLPRAVELVLVILHGFGLLALLVGFLAYLRYLMKLTLRIPDQQLSKRARFLFFGFIIAPAAGILVITLQAIITLTLGAGGASIILPTGCVFTLILLAMLVFALMALRLQHRIGRACREQARLARETWAGPSTEE